MKVYKYLVVFENGDKLEFFAFSKTEAIFLATAHQIRGGKNYTVSDIMDDDGVVWKVNIDIEMFPI